MATAEITSLTLILSPLEANALEKMLGALTGQMYTDAGLNGAESEAIGCVYNALGDALHGETD